MFIFRLRLKASFSVKVVGSDIMCGIPITYLADDFIDKMIFVLFLVCVFFCHKKNYIYAVLFIFSDMQLKAKHVIFLIYVELSVLLRLPYIPTQGFVFSTNVTVPLTFCSLFLLMLAYTQGQMKLSAAPTYKMWEVINIFRKYVLIVFCVNAEFCNSVLGFFLLVAVLLDKLQGKQTVLSNHLVLVISYMFASIVIFRVFLQGRALVLLWGLVQWIFLRDSSEVSYMTQQIYMPWVLIMMN